ncbi:MAG: UDP-3-O-(3-hydroxymyristoyl)glucosamine N-acyltransferase [Clostridiales bacterium]|nr:UDP-3-O-(3-hydroxymyristoyl)glucosamine N-acyltransferase [Clostridiales bacterium]
MLISKILKERNIHFYSEGEEEVDSLGLIGYNAGDRYNVATFVENSKYICDFPSNIKLIITKRYIAEKIRETRKDIGLIVVDDPRNCFFKLHNYLAKKTIYKRENFKSKIDDSAKISQLSSISQNNVVIGENTIIEEFVVVRENTIIGDNVIIRAGSTIGSEGFEFKTLDEETYRVEHIGGVILEDNVEIQYNTCVDRAIYPWDNTFIGTHSKIDNLVHVAHGVRLGKNVMIAAGATIGGRCNIGDNSWIGIGAVIRNGLMLGDNSRANMGSVVTKNVESNESVSGNFAIEHRKFIDRMKGEK